MIKLLVSPSQQEHPGGWRCKRESRSLACSCARVCVCSGRGQEDDFFPEVAERLSYEPERSARGKTPDGSVSASSSVPDFCLQPQLLTGGAPTGSPPSYTLAGVEEPGDIVVFPRPRRNKLKKEPTDAAMTAEFIPLGNHWDPHPAAAPHPIQPSLLEEDTMRYRMNSAFLALLLGVVSSFAERVNLNLTRMKTCRTETQHKCASTKLGEEVWSVPKRTEFVRNF